jgi:hypothetical protein
MPKRNAALIYFSKQQKKPKTEGQRVKLTARITLAAYDAITEVQRRHRRKTGKALRLWEVLNAAIIAYANKQGIRVRE